MIISLNFQHFTRVIIIFLTFQKINFYYCQTLKGIKIVVK